MHTDEQYGQQLAVRLRHETEDVQAAPDLIWRLHRQQARRTWVLRTVVATPVVAAAAVAIMAMGVGPGAPAGGQQTASGSTLAGASGAQWENVAFVRSETTKALAQSSQYVLHAETTWTDTRFEWWRDETSQRLRSDTYLRSPKVPLPPSKRDPQTGEVVSTAPGAPGSTELGPIHLGQSHSVSGPKGHQTTTTVDYETRTWYTDHYQEPPKGDLPDLTNPDEIRRLVTDGKLEVLGKETVNGIECLHLRLYTEVGPARIEMWVDAGSYLPVREITTKSTGPGKYPDSLAGTTTYSWLPRTDENLAHLVLTPPPGFRHIVTK